MCSISVRAHAMAMTRAEVFFRVTIRIWGMVNVCSWFRVRAMSMTRVWSSAGNRTRLSI